MASTADMQKVVNCISNGTLALSLCRVCLKPLDEAAENAFTKICKEDHEYSVADILKGVCNIELSEVDGYQVCSNCFLSANTAYKFYLLTKQSDVILNFYVEKLLRNVDSIILPQHVDSESLYITLPMVVLENKKDTLSDDEDKVVLKQDNDNPKFVKTLPEGASTESDEDWATEDKIFHNNSSTKRVPLKRKIRDKFPVLDCWMCPEKFKLIIRLKRHLKKMHKIEIFVCKVCKKFFTDEKDLNIHLSVHPNILKCDECGSIFKQRLTLIRHIENHEIEKKPTTKPIHMCEFCGEVFKNIKLLQHHNNEYHKKLYTCEYCGKIYRCEFSFNSHLQKHEKNMPEMDKKPQRRTKSKSPYTSEYLCTFCGRSCASERALLWHTRLHTNEKPFKCDECGCTFVSMNRVKQHVQTKHMAPTRRCPLCPALFHLNSSVNTHIKRVHLRVHKRGPRQSKHPNVNWKTKQVPVKDLSVSLYSQIVALQGKATDNAGVPGNESCATSGEEE